MHSTDDPVSVPFRTAWPKHYVLRDVFRRDTGVCAEYTDTRERFDPANPALQPAFMFCRAPSGADTLTLLGITAKDAQERHPVERDLGAGTKLVLGPDTTALTDSEAHQLIDDVDTSPTLTDDTTWLPLR